MLSAIVQKLEFSFNLKPSWEHKRQWAEVRKFEKSALFVRSNNQGNGPNLTIVAYSAYNRVSRDTLSSL